MNFTEINNNIPPVNERTVLDARRHWDSIAKPLGSLGLLEDAVVSIAAATGSPDVHIDKRAVFVLCADNGVVAEGVTQAGSEVTMAVAKNLTKNKTSVCRMAQAANCDVIPVDMGMNTRPDFPGLISRRTADGTRNIAEGPAMSPEQAVTALESGIELARDASKQGYKILVTGEMGIGNTTTSSALASVLLGLPPATVTGRGSGLSDKSLSNKIAVIERAIMVNKPNPAYALDLLSKLGGFDIAGMAGIFLGGALYSVPVLIDGFISSVSALVALRLCPGAKIAMLASHVSSEPAAAATLNALGLRPLITAGMHLGEGTGGVAALPLLDLALAVYNGSSSFDEIGVDAYTPQK